jgi:citrate lyase subunit beta / citryl-CoA lyase
VTAYGKSMLNPPRPSGSGSMTPALTLDPPAAAPGGSGLVVLPAGEEAPEGTALYRAVPGAHKAGGAAAIAAALAAAPDGRRVPSLPVSGLPVSGLPVSGLLVSGLADGRDLTLIDARLAVAEAEAGLAQGATALLAVAAATPQALLAIETLVGATPRLRGLVHDPEALRQAVGSEAPDLVRLARALTVAAAHAAGVPAYDADPASTAAGARRDGFAARLVPFNR